MATVKETNRNENITALKLRVIDAEGNQIGVITREKALQLSSEAALDLVEIVPNADPPVCRIMDYGKFKFQQAKKAHSAKKKQKITHIKEIKFRPGTEEADYQVKLKAIKRFLDAGDKVKVTLRFRGREMAHKEVGKELLERVELELQEIANVEQQPKMEGRLMNMMLAPKKNI